MLAKAKDSPHILKVRRKLQRHLAAADELISADALSTMRQIIKKKLTTYQPGRINLKSKNITTFDENQHPAKTENKFVIRLLDELKHPDLKKKPKRLAGRVTNIQENNPNDGS